MRIDLIRPDAWDLLSDQYRAKLPLQDPNLTVQIYQGYQHAVWESTQALAKIFPHKKSIAIVQQGEPVFEAVSVAFSAEGYIVHLVKQEDFGDPQKWPGGGLAALQNDLLFILSSEDHPVTARRYHYPDLQLALKSVRVFSIMISHAGYRYSEMPAPGPFDVRILSLKTDRALLIGGTRVKIRPPLLSLLPWAREKPSEIESELKISSENEIAVATRAVLAFENALPSGFRPYFASAVSPQPANSRVWDRAVIYHPDYDGSAVLHELRKTAPELFGEKTSEEVVDDVHDVSFLNQACIDTMSPCRWESARLSDWLRAQNEPDELVRGLISIAAPLLGAPLKKALEVVAQNLEVMQNGPT